MSRATRLYDEDEYRFYINMQMFLSQWMANNGVEWSTYDRQIATTTLVSVILDWLGGEPPFGFPPEIFIEDYWLRLRLIKFDKTNDRLDPVHRYQQQTRRYRLVSKKEEEQKKMGNSQAPAREIWFDTMTTDELEMKKEIEFQKERADFWFRAARAERSEHEATAAKLDEMTEKHETMTEKYETMIAKLKETKKRKIHNTRSNKKARNNT